MAFDILATFKVISGWVQTCDIVHSQRLYSVALLVKTCALCHYNVVSYMAVVYVSQIVGVIIEKLKIHNKIVLLVLVVFFWCFFLFVPYWQHLRSYHARYRLVTGRRYSAAVLDQTLGIITPFPTHSHYTNTELTGPYHIPVMPSIRQGINCTCRSLAWLSQDLKSLPSAREAAALANTRWLWVCDIIVKCVCVYIYHVYIIYI